MHPTDGSNGLLPNCAVPFPTHEAAALKFQPQPQAVPASSPFRDGCHGFCCQLALCHNSYSVVLSTATQRFGRRNLVLFSILPVIKMLSSFHAKIAHDGSNSTFFAKVNLLINYHKVIFPSITFYRLIALFSSNSPTKRIHFANFLHIYSQNRLEIINMSYFATQSHQIFYIFHRQHFFYDSAQQIKRHLHLTNENSVFFHFFSFHPSRCSTISRLSRPTRQSRNSTLTSAAFASASAVPNSGCVPTFGLTSVTPSI